MYEDVVRDRITRPPCYGDDSRYDPDTRLCGFECPFRAGKENNCPDHIVKKQRLEAIRGRVDDMKEKAGLRGPVAPSQVRITGPTSAPIRQGSTAMAQVTTTNNSAVAYERDENDPWREAGVRIVCAGAAAGFDEMGRIARNDGYRLLRRKEKRTVVRCSACKALSDEHAKACGGCGREFDT